MKPFALRSRAEPGVSKGAEIRSWPSFETLPAFAPQDERIADGPCQVENSIALGGASFGLLTPAKSW